MAEEIVDALVLAARFDEHSMDASAQAAARSGIAALVKAAQQAGQGLDFNLDTGSLVAAFAKAGSGIRDILREIREQFAAFGASFKALSPEGTQIQAFIEQIKAVEAALPPLAAAATATAGALHPIAEAMGAIAAQSTPMTRAMTSAANEAVLFSAATSSMAEAMGRAAAQSTPMTRAMASAAAESQQAAVGVGAMAAVMSTVAAQSNAMTRAMSSAAVSAESLAARSEGAATRIHSMTAAMAESARASNQMIAGMSAAGRAAQASATGAGHLTEHWVGVARGAGSAEAGVARVRSGLAQLAVLTLRTNSAVGQVAQGLIFLGGFGSGTIIALAAAVLSGTLAWEKYSEASRKAKEESEALGKALDSLRESQRDPVGRAKEQFEDQRAVVDGLVQDLVRLQEAQQAASRGVVGGSPDAAIATQNQLRTDQANILQRLQLENQRLAAANKALGDAEAEAAEKGTGATNARIALIQKLGRELAVLQLGEDRVSELEAGAIGGADVQELQRRVNAINAQRKAEEEARKAAEAAAKAQEELTAKFNAFWDDIEAKANLAGPAVVARLREIQKAQADTFSDRLGDSIEQGFEAAAKAAENLRTPADDAADAAERLLLAFDAMDGAAFALAAIGDALGFIDEQGQRALRSIQDIVSAAARGDIFGILAGGAGVLGSILGKDATQQEHEQIQAQNANTLATERNTAAVERASTAGGLGETQRQLREALNSRVGEVAKAFAESSITFGDRGAHAFDVALRAAGSSLEELQQIAKDNGIELLDSKGRLVAGSLDALNEAINRAREKALTPDDSIAARRARLETEDTLGISARSRDPEVARLERERQIQLDALNLDPATEARIKALDLETVEGRKAFLEFEQDLFKRAQNHGLTDTELGAFQNVDELDQSIDIAANGLDGLADAAKDAAGELSDFNLPPGFKRSALVFQNEAAGPSRPWDGASLPLPGSPPLRGTDINVSVKVDPSSAPEDVRRAAEAGAQAGLTKALHKIGFLQSGDTMQLGVR